MSSVITPILTFPEISKNDVLKVGSKAANIGELSKARIPVPAGFVTTAESYFYFLDMARIREKIVDILASLDAENSKELEEASNLIQDMIIKSTIPPVIENAILKSYAKLSGFVGTYVAVRSSISYDDDGEDSFAGMSSTFLNIKGGKDVVLAIKACWASLFEPSSIYYRSTKGLSHMKAGMPVIVQKMVQSEVSGVMFTQNPVTLDPSNIVIESVLGLGDMIDSDTYTPDHYEVSKQGQKIEVKKVAKQTHMIVRSTKHKDHEEQVKKVQVADKWQNAQKIEDSKILELASIGKLVEQHFGMPQDIEWVMEGNKLYILQARSINGPDTLTHVNPLEKEIISIQTDSQQTTSNEETAPSQTQIFENIQNDSKFDKASAGQIILSGSPASEGITEGKVTIVKKNDDFINLNDGDILVIDKILPDYILWMRKAAGIITNEGGMTSHAAILSREFKIPCIVGTENATEVLVNGEYVLVNGDNGRVYLKEPITESLQQVNQDTILPTDAVEDVNPSDSQVMAEFEPQVLPSEETLEINEQPDSPVEAQAETEPESQVQFDIPQVIPASIPPVIPGAPVDKIVPELNLGIDMNEAPIDQSFGGQVTYEREQTELKNEERQNAETFIPATTKNIKTATKILVNVSDPEISNEIFQRGADGIGYVNGTEVLNRVIKRHPEEFIEDEIIEKYISELSSVLEKLCAQFNPRPVIYRPSNLIPSQLNFEWGRFESEESNPLLGYNGAIKYIQNPSLFNLEIEAIKTVRNRFGYKNLSLMLPMVRDTKDLREIKKIITSNDLKRSSTFKIYLPVESPSTILLVQEMIDIGIDGIFIFAKTLSGMLNSADLSNPKYRSYPVFNKAFMMASEVIIKTAHKDRIPTGVILEGMEFEEHALKEFIEWGAIELSIDPYYIDKTKSTVADIEKSLILSKRK